jgi:hypothetical protein
MCKMSTVDIRVGENHIVIEKPVSDARVRFVIVELNDGPNVELPFVGVVAVRLQGESCAIEAMGVLRGSEAAAAAYRVGGVVAQLPKMIEII